MKAVCIIPARGGSKRIPRKNIRDFLGKPIIAYSIEAALNSCLFDMVMVSTDDDEIGDIARRFGAEVPFMRSAKTADDFAGTDDVIVEVLEQLTQRGNIFDYVCCIYPTAPLISIESLGVARNIMLEKNLNSVFPVVKFSVPIQRALQITEDKVSMMSPEYRNVRSQDLPPAFYDAGQFYWGTTKQLLQGGSLLSKNSGAIVLDNMCVQDIDNESDWKLAELKYKIINHG